MRYPARPHVSATQTHDPSARKLALARNRGDVATSAELVTASVLAASWLSLVYGGAALVRACGVLLSTAFSAARLDVQQPLAQLGPALHAVCVALLPLLLAPAAAALLAVLLQSGFSFSSGARRSQLADTAFLSSARAGSSALALIKIVLVAWVLGSAVLRSARGILDAWQSEPARLGQVAFMLIGDILLRAALAFCLLGAADLVYQRMRRRQRLRMTRRELQDEQRETHGDPKLLAERKRRWHDVAVQNGLAELTRASLVVHGAADRVVALRIALDEHPAPRLWVKGEGELAQRMLASAAQQGLPLHQDVELTTALYRLEPAEPVPSALYSQVARLCASKAPRA